MSDNNRTETGLTIDPYENINNIQFRRVDASPSSGILNIASFINTNVNTSEIQTKLLREIQRRNWWLQEYWRTKGLPREQFVVKTPKGTLHIFNFNPKALSDEQLRELLETVSSFLNVKGGLLFEKVEFVLIDDLQVINPNTGEDGNGYGLQAAKAIQLYPRALADIPHRVSHVSNFQGTLIHEFTELLTNEIQKEWKEKFFRDAEFPITLPGGTQTIEIPIDKSRCVTQYATYRVRDDISDSMVALIKQPNLLDKEKLRLLKDRLTNPDLNKSSHQQITIRRLVDNEIKIPRVEQPVRYRIVNIKPPGV